MKLKNFFLIALMSSGFILNSFGQNPSSPEPPWWGRIGNQNGRTTQIPIRRTPPLTQSQKEILDEERKNTQIVLEKLQAPAIYYEKYKDFLKSDTNRLVRIYADLNCDKGKTVSVSELERCSEAIPVLGGGSQYSFRTGNHTNRYSEGWWDLHFTGRKLELGSEFVQAVATEIGDIDLAKLRLNSAAFSFLKNYKPAKTTNDLKEQKKLLAEGVRYDGFTYSNLIPAKINSTYILRSIAYYLDNEQVYRIRRRSDLPYSTGKGVDITVAFRIVGTEPDGSLILLWRELKLDLPRRKLKTS